MAEQIARKYLDYDGLERFYKKLKETDLANLGGGDSIPAGLIAMWSGSIVPEGWALCDGQNGTPDLADKFILGTSDLKKVGTTKSDGGSLFTAGEDVYVLAYIIKQ